MRYLKGRSAHSVGPLQIVLIRACLYGGGACADFTLKSAALIKTKSEWLLGEHHSGSSETHLEAELRALVLFNKRVPEGVICIPRGTQVRVGG